MDQKEAYEKANRLSTEGDEATRNFMTSVLRGYHKFGGFTNNQLTAIQNWGTSSKFPESQWVGEVGVDEIVVTGRILFVGEYKPQYATRFILVADADGNVFTFNGKGEVEARAAVLGKGGTITVVGVVAAHETYKERKSTRLAEVELDPDAA